MEKRFDVIALGELLIDFTENGLSEQGNPLLEANPGGAPCNVLAMLQKLGRRTAFIGKVGRDMFGTQLRQVTEDAGICMDYLLEDQAVHTTLAFVKTFPNGDRDFSFYREPGADMMLRPEELPAAALESTGIFHFGTLSMTHPEVRQATRRAVALAKAAGALVSFDPNLRPPLWHSLEEAREQIAWGLGQCHVLKIADNELEFMTGEKDFRMSDHDDEVVLLNFWATWCGPCVKEMNDLGKLADEYKGKAVVCCISVGDDWRTVCQFANERPNLREYLGCADGTAISDFYPSDYIPYTVITKGGIVQATYVGSRSYDDYKKILDSYLD